MTEEEISERLCSITTRRLFRKIPQDDIQIIKYIHKASQTPNPCLNLLYIWGVHKKPLPDAFEDKAIKFLVEVMEKLQETFSLTPKLHILLCDSHGKSNNVSEEAISSYVTAMTKLFIKQGWLVTKLSTIELGWDKATDNSKISLFQEEDLSPELLAYLERGSKNFMGLDKTLGWHKYLNLRLSERPLIANSFPEHIYLSAAPTEMLQPALPTMWVWATGRYQSKLPWFNKD